MFAFLFILAVNSTGVFLTACCYGFASAAIQGLYTSTIISFASRGGPVAAKKMGLVLAAVGRTNRRIVNWEKPWQAPAHVAVCGYYIDDWRVVLRVG